MLNYFQVTVTTSQTSGELANETGGVIHSAIYQSREDVGAIVHTHIPEIVAVACLEKGSSMESWRWVVLRYPPKVHLGT